MKKTEQLEINAKVEKFLTDFDSNVNLIPGNEYKLRSCSADVAEVINSETGRVEYYVLRSYNTIVAAIDTRTDTLYDFLRKVYGFTSTSAQHISKFEKDYCQDKWNCAERLTWKVV